jgi:hypothetical protein
MLSVTVAVGLALLGQVHTVDAATCGTPCNTTMFEAGDNLPTRWYSNTTYQVSQRYGCTSLSVEDRAPSGWCPPAFSHWHHGIDIAMPTTAILCRPSVDVS